MKWISFIKGFVVVLLLDLYVYSLQCMLFNSQTLAELVEFVRTENSSHEMA